MAPPSVQISLLCIFILISNYAQPSSTIDRLSTFSGKHPWPRCPSTNTTAKINEDHPLEINSLSSSSFARTPIYWKQGPTCSFEPSSLPGPKSAFETLAKISNYILRNLPTPLNSTPFWIRGKDFVALASSSWLCKSLRHLKYGPSQTGHLHRRRLVILLIFLLAGDIESNPGPATKQVTKPTIPKPADFYP